VDLSVDEMIEKIEGLPEERLREIQGFLLNMDNIVRVGTKLAHKKIDIEKCSNYLRELTPLKKLVESLHHHRNVNPPDDRFSVAEVELLKLNALYQDKVIKRLELAINLEIL
jgi:hypothetical protein